MNRKNTSFRNFWAAPLVTFIFLTLTGIITWRIQGDPFMLITFLYIGIFTAGGMTLFIVLPKKKKSWGRKISFFMVGGLLLLIGVGLLGRVNVQLEGLFFYILAGFYAGTIIHYMVAKVIGPIVLHRSWCGWGCWTMMILDMLPYKKGSGWVPGKWFRYLHFVISALLVLVLWFVFDYSIIRNDYDINGLYWLIAGNGLYYISGIGLAIMLKDNRAFCKYVCPITVFLKISSSFSLLRIKGDRSLCTDCKACIKTCPMDILIPEYVTAGQRMLSTECVLCMTCIDTCPTGALQASLGFDLGGRELLHERNQG